MWSGLPHNMAASGHSEACMVSQGSKGDYHRRTRWKLVTFCDQAWNSHSMASAVVRRTPSWEECLSHLVGRTHGQNILRPSAPVLSLTFPFCSGYFSHPNTWTLAPYSLFSGSLLSSHSPQRLPQHQRLEWNQPPDLVVGGFWGFVCFIPSDQTPVPQRTIQFLILEVLRTANSISPWES